MSFLEGFTSYSIVFLQSKELGLKKQSQKGLFDSLQSFSFPRLGGIKISFYTHRLAFIGNSP